MLFGYLDNLKGDVSYSVHTISNMSVSGKEDTSRGAAGLHVGIAAASGTIFFQPLHVGNHTLVVVATDMGGSSGSQLESYPLNELGLTLDQAIIKQWSFEIRARDSDACHNGPRGRCCANNGAVVDAVQFDESFSCQCEAAYQGLSCEEPVPAAVDDGNSTIIGYVAPLSVRTLRCFLRGLRGRVFLLFRCVWKRRACERGRGGGSPKPVKDAGSH